MARTLATSVGLGSLGFWVWKLTLPCPELGLWMFIPGTILVVAFGISFRDPDWIPVPLAPVTTAICLLLWSIPGVPISQYTNFIGVLGGLGILLTLFPWEKLKKD